MYHDWSRDYYAIQQTKNNNDSPETSTTLWFYRTWVYPVHTYTHTHTRTHAHTHTHTQTYDNSIYHTCMASRGKN